MVVLALVGCRDRSEPAPSLPCEPVLSAARDRLVAANVQGIALRTELMIAACEGDRWDPRVLRCLQAAADQRTLDRCLSQLTHEQFVRLSGTLAPLSPQVDAAVSAGVDASVPSDASVNSSVDAMPVDARTDAAVTRPRPDARKLDCTRGVLDARDADCRRSYCLANPQAAVCVSE